MRTGIIRAMHPDETVRRRIDEIAAGLANLLKTLGAAKEQRVGRIKEYDQMIQQPKKLS